MIEWGARGERGERLHITSVHEGQLEMGGGKYFIWLEEFTSSQIKSNLDHNAIHDHQLQLYYKNTEIA